MSGAIPPFPTCLHIDYRDNFYSWKFEPFRFVWPVISTSLFRKKIPHSVPQYRYPLCKCPSGQVFLHVSSGSCSQWTRRTIFHTPTSMTRFLQSADRSELRKFRSCSSGSSPFLVAYERRHPSGWKVGRSIRLPSNYTYYGPRALRHQHTWSG